MWPLKPDSGKRLKAAASVLAWRLEDVRMGWRFASREGRRSIARALCVVECTLAEVRDVDFRTVDLRRSDRFFALIERANRVVDHIESRLQSPIPSVPRVLATDRRLSLKAS